MARPGEIDYGFSDLDQSAEFNSFLDLKLDNSEDFIDLETCKEGRKIILNHLSKKKQK